MEFPGIMLSSVLNGSNKMAYSKLHEISHERKDPTSEIGIKYVIGGEERYFLNRKTQRVKEGFSLLVNRGQIYDTILPYSRQEVKGICINLDMGLLNEVYNSCFYGEEWLLEYPGKSTVRQFDFLETIYNANDVLNSHLAAISKTVDLETGQTSIPAEELFYGIACKLLLSQKLISEQVRRIDATRTSTQKELFKRVYHAKCFMEDNRMSPVAITDVAAQVSLSEFHFFRVFKQVYGVSPHQYLIAQRLDHAKQALMQSQKSITEIAFLSGFADVHTFSKSFKKAFAVSPEKFRMGTCKSV
jgi:AraC family transcriptional regulator